MPSSFPIEIQALYGGNFDNARQVDSATFTMNRHSVPFFSRELDEVYYGRDMLNMSISRYQPFVSSSTTFTLMSSAPEIVTVPESITLTSLAANFDVIFGDDVTSADVTITATNTEGTSSVERVITLRRIGISSFTATPNIVGQGDAITATLMLDSAPDQSVRGDFSCSNPCYVDGVTQFLTVFSEQDTRNVNLFGGACTSLDASELRDTTITVNLVGTEATATV